MSINIKDLKNNFDSNSSSSLFGDQDGSINLRELSKRELKTSGGGGNPGFRTVIVSDDDLDVYIIDNSFPVNFVHNPNPANVKFGGKINFRNGNAVMRRNGNLDITFSDSDSSSSSSSSS